MVTSANLIFTGISNTNTIVELTRHEPSPLMWASILSAWTFSCRGLSSKISTVSLEPQKDHCLFLCLKSWKYYANSGMKNGKKESKRVSSEKLSGLSFHLSHTVFCDSISKHNGKSNSVGTWWNTKCSRWLFNIALESQLYHQLEMLSTMGTLGTKMASRFLKLRKVLFWRRISYPEGKFRPWFLWSKFTLSWQISNHSLYTHYSNWVIN